MYINIFQKLRVLRDKFDRQNNYTRVPHFPVIIPDDFPHIFFFPVLSSLKIIAIRYELSTRVDRRGKERRGNGRWEGKGKEDDERTIVYIHIHEYGQNNALNSLDWIEISSVYLLLYCAPCLFDRYIDVHLSTRTSLTGFAIL